MKIKKINYWSSEIDMEDGRHIFIYDRWLKSYRESRVRLVFSRVFIQIGCICILCGVFLLVGLAGRSELLSELGEVDDWSFFTYLYYILWYIILILIGSFVTVRAEKSERRSLKKVQYLLKQRNI